MWQGWPLGGRGSCSDTTLSKSGSSRTDARSILGPANLIFMGGSPASQSLPSTQHRPQLQLCDDFACLDRLPWKLCFADKYCGTLGGSNTATHINSYSNWLLCICLLHLPSLMNADTYRQFNRSAHPQKAVLVWFKTSSEESRLI